MKLRILCAALLIAAPAFARDDGRYAGSPLKPWFESLKSGKGPCCSDADGAGLLDTDWESKDGHYRVRIENQWWDVPDEAVITELLDRLTAQNVELAAEIAAIPEFIRGYGPVKTRHLADAKAREAQLLAQWRDPNAARVRVPIRAAA